MPPIALILRTAGINCDRELAHAFRLVGAEPVSVHINRLIDDPTPLTQAQLIGFPGGFSHGDDIAAGRIFANRLRHRLFGHFLAALRRGVPMIGICNGFQVMVKAGLLPDPQTPPDPPAPSPHALGLTASAVAADPPPNQTATLADNTSGRFVDRWVSLRAEPESVCIWTRGLADLDSFDLPIAHGEGRFCVSDGSVLRSLQANRQIALRYARVPDSAPPASGHPRSAIPVNFPGNPNGSDADIAGICDPTGLVFGLMPHPERYTHPTHHPLWTRPSDEAMLHTPMGLRFFRNAVEHVAGRPAAVALA